MAANFMRLVSRWSWEFGLKPAAIAGFFILVALLWTFPLQHVMAYPFVFLFFGAIIGSTWFGGLIAGVIAIVASYVLIAFFFIPPLYSVAVGQESRAYVAAYLMCGIAAIAVSAFRKRSETAIRIARDELETKVQERTAELRRSNQEILERERQLKLLTESIHQQIWSADADGNIEYCNRDLLDYTGKDLQDLKGEAFFSIFHPDDARPFRESWDAARSSIRLFELQTRVRGANDDYRLFLVRGIPQRTAKGEVVRWYGVHIDIEDQQRAQQRRQLAQEDLSRSNRTITLAEMAATIAHQLNQPLAALSTDASACQQWLKAQPPNLDRAYAASERIVRDSARASAVVSRVRSLFGRSDYVREPTDLNLLILELVWLLRDDAKRREVSFDLKLDEDLPKLKVDPVQIQQVLLNLAVNGMDAMQETRQPRVLQISSCLRSTDEVVVAMRDCGKGFSKKVQEKLFEPFFTTKADGTGMGLAICRSIIEAHDGRISGASSENGAVFEFVLKANA
jgi:PAS domain S-box-containing protein